MLLDVKCVLCSLFKIEHIEVARFETTEQRLDQDGRAVAFETTFQTVNIDF